MRAAILLVLALLFPLFASGMLPAASQVLIFVILATGLNIVVGYAGLLHLGYAAFFAVGAFTMAYLTSPQSPLGWGWNFWPALLCCVLVTAATGAVLAAPVMRLRGDYLAIVTMGFGLMLDPILRNFDDQTKAVTGMSAIAGPGVNRTGWYYLLLACVLLCVGLAYRVRHSPLGRSLRAQREDPIAAEAAGISLAASKLQAFVLGASIAGLAGGLYASYIFTLNLAFPLDFNGSIMVLAMVILGGVGSIEGAVVGALALGILNLVITPKLIDWMNATVRGPLSTSLSPQTWSWLEPILDLSKAQFLLFGATLVLMMLLRPEGLVPERPVRYEEPSK